MLSLALVGLAAGAAVSPDLEAAFAAMAQVKSLQASFTQVQTRQVLSRPLESSGTLAFTRPDRLRWEVTSPAPSLFVLEGTLVGNWWPQLGVREEVDLGERPEVRRTVEAMMVWLQADLAAVQRDFTVTWTAPVARLVPRAEPLNALIHHLDLTVSGAPPRVETVVIAEPDGDRVEIRLTDVVLDPVLPDGTFRLPAR